MIGTGLKKCIPMNRSGCDIADASLVMEIDDVLDATIVFGPDQRIDPFEDIHLYREVFGRCLDYDIGRSEGFQFYRSAD